MAPKRNTPSNTSSTSASQPTVLSTPAQTSSSPSTSTHKSSSSHKQQQHQSPAQIAVGIWQRYTDTTPQRTKLIDVFMSFLVVVGVLQFVYCVLVGNYPFNAFLSGFSATVGQFVLTASLRIQTNVENKAEFSAVSPERAFADYVFGSLILHFFCVNFIN
ncbi:hypothetical protein HYFRA_00011187 [Hymenoscyphus fraxineus]|uniref:Dolichyl-diphosphooligosaccharide--protein glycosyltransferase subunit OST2 n=1 Tax=Hymenoscyphus fraxineus TaxID=746836 RepID=A0A9N9PVK4_9HELO|nr:hypothetical protein HYFRA_00011187 [Hymenoscyphus fraxineus]